MGEAFGGAFSKWSGAEAAPGLAGTGVLVINLVLVAFLVVCAYTDGTRGKIYNKYTFPAMLAGVVLNGAFGGVEGLKWAGLGWAVGMGIQWVPFMLGLAKAGDVKLLAAVGALKGWAFCSFGFLYGALAFAFLILPWLARRGELKEVGRNIAGYAQMAAATQSAPDAPAPVVTKKFVPWGVGLCIGFFIALAIELAKGRPIWFAL
jgi:prepilin peptidase CpaA